MTALDLAAIRARADAATEGPWFRNYGDVTRSSIYPEPDDVAEGYDEPRNETIARRGISRGMRDPQAIADAEFIAHAREDVPALLDALEAVLALHVPEVFHPDACAGCSSPSVWVGWPCATARAAGVTA